VNVPGHFSHAYASRRAAPAILALLVVTGFVWAAAGPWLEPSLAREIRAAAPREVRGLWVQRGTLSSPEAIARMVGEAASAGFNTLLVQVRGRGDAFFAGGIDPRAAALSAQPSSYDPLATVLAAARAAGLRVHLWINVNLVADATRLPDARTHVVLRHPEWLMVPRALAADLGWAEPRTYIQSGNLIFRAAGEHQASQEGAADGCHAAHHLGGQTVHEQDHQGQGDQVAAGEALDPRRRIGQPPAVSANGVQAGKVFRGAHHRDVERPAFVCRPVPDDLDPVGRRVREGPEIGLDSGVGREPIPQAVARHPGRGRNVLPGETPRGGPEDQRRQQDGAQYRSHGVHMVLWSKSDRRGVGDRRSA